MMMTMMMMMTERRRLGRETRRRTHTTRELLRINLQLCCYYKYIVGLDVARIRINTYNILLPPNPRITNRLLS